MPSSFSPLPTKSDAILALIVVVLITGLGAVFCYLIFGQITIDWLLLNLVAALIGTSIGTLLASSDDTKTKQARRQLV